jgi:hypothetical protein
MLIFKSLTTICVFIYVFFLPIQLLAENESQIHDKALIIAQSLNNEYILDDKSDLNKKTNVDASDLIKNVADGMISEKKIQKEYRNE